MINIIAYFIVLTDTRMHSKRVNKWMKKRMDKRMGKEEY